MDDLIFRRAVVQEAPQIAALVNQSYRGETSRQGWTTEADLLDGLRTSSDEVERLIKADNSIILLCHLGSELVGVIHLENVVQQVNVGMFVINPALQNQGFGKQLLAAAESVARQKWAAKKLVMMVISTRPELVAYYERRGYQPTGEVKEFPVNPEMWQPKVAGLKLVKLEKTIV